MRTIVKINGIDDKAYPNCTASVDQDGCLSILDEDEGVVDEFDVEDWDSVHTENEGE